MMMMMMMMVIIIITIIIITIRIGGEPICPSGWDMDKTGKMERARA